MADSIDLGPLTEAIKEFQDWWDAKIDAADLSARTGCPLYQYTDSPGLSGIIRNQELWLHNILQMNDTRELDFGMALARRELRRRSQNRGGVIEFLAESMIEAWDDQIGGCFDFYVGSLTPKGNDLVQWRFYGDDARGFALGFPAKSIHNLDAYVTRVIYGRAEVVTRQAEAIDKAFEIVDRNMKHVLEDGRRSLEFLKQLSVQLSVPLLWHSFSSKDLAYKQEKEVRLMVVKRAGDRSDVFTRLRWGEEVRYVKVSVPLRSRRDFSHIVIGPYAHPEAPLAIQRFLEPYGISSEKLVHRSRIPYRSAERPEPVDKHFDPSK